MEPDRISQWRAFVRIRAEIEPDGVSIRERGPLTLYETKVPFTDIPDDHIRVSRIPRPWFIGTLLCGIWLAYNFFQYLQGEEVRPASFVIWPAVFFALLAASLWVQSGRVVGYLCRDARLFFFDKRGGNSPEPFLRRIQEAKRAYLHELYAEAVAERNEAVGESEAQRSDLEPEEPHSIN